MADDPVGTPSRAAHAHRASANPAEEQRKVADLRKITKVCATKANGVRTTDVLGNGFLGIVVDFAGAAGEVLSFVGNLLRCILCALHPFGTFFGSAFDTTPHGARQIGASILACFRREKQSEHCACRYAQRKYS